MFLKGLDLITGEFAIDFGNLCRITGRNRYDVTPQNVYPNVRISCL
jgi:hypothetical protein